MSFFRFLIFLLCSGLVYGATFQSSRSRFSAVSLKMRIGGWSAGQIVVCCQCRVPIKDRIASKIGFQKKVRRGMEFSGRRIPTVAHAIPAVTTATYPRKLSESTPEEAPLVLWERILIAKGEIRHDLVGETVLMCARFGNYGSDAVLFRIRSGKALSGTSRPPPKKKCEEECLAHRERNSALKSRVPFRELDAYPRLRCIQNAPL